MKTLSNYTVNPQAFAGTAQRREEILLPLAGALQSFHYNCSSDKDVWLAKLALYQAATTASLKGRADKGMVDLAVAAAKLPAAAIQKAASKIVANNPNDNATTVIAKIANKLAGLARHMVALETDGIEVKLAYSIGQLEDGLSTAKTEAEKAAKAEAEANA